MCANGHEGRRDQQDAAIRTVTATEDKAFDTADVNSGQTVTIEAPARPGTNPRIRTFRPAANGSPTAP